MDDTKKHKTLSIRAQFGRQLKRAVGPPPLLSPEIVAPYLGLSHTAIYTRIKDPLYLPSVAECELIGDFLLNVRELKKSLRAVIVLKSWDALISNSFASGVFHTDLLKTIQSKDTLEKRVNKMLRKILQDGTKRIKSREV